jgi:hypothetical protein
VEALAVAPGPGGDAARIDLLRALEELGCAAQALQAAVTGSFDRSQRAEARERGVPTELRGRGIAQQVGLARRESPHRGQRHLGLAVVLRDELPRTMAAFRAGRITEWKATLIARETACLSLPQRREVDELVAADPGALEVLSDRELAGLVARHAYRLDPDAAVARRAKAESERRVSLRPAPDGMTWLGALLPMKDGVGVLAALRREADAAVAAGDPRGRGQLMADTLVARVTGAAPADATTTVVNLVVSDQVLAGADESGGWVQGYGPVPSVLARELAADAALLRRLYANPGTGQLVAMESRARIFPPALARYLRFRDRDVCRSPWCDAPVAHLDHVRPVAEGGPTTAANGQGLCQGCNHAKQAPGWSARPLPGPGPHTVETRTPTGHVYLSRAPAGEYPGALGRPTGSARSETLRSRTGRSRPGPGPRRRRKASGGAGQAPVNVTPAARS